MLCYTLIRTEQILQESGDSVHPPPCAGSVPLAGASGRPTRKAAPCRSDMVIEEAGSEESGSNYEGDDGKEEEEGTTDEGEEEEKEGKGAGEEKEKDSTETENLAS